MSTHYQNPARVREESLSLGPALSALIGGGPARDPKTFCGSANDLAVLGLGVWS